MSDNFKQVVDLQAAAKSSSAKTRETSSMKKMQTSVKKNHTNANRAKEIDQVFNDQTIKNVTKDLHTIKQPIAKNRLNNLFKQISLILLAVIIILVAYYFLVLKKKINYSASSNVVSTNQTAEWYAVKLANDEVYYGLINDTSADPLVLQKVYYNYNQAVDQEKVQEDKTANIRLIKRGKEAYGPSGDMEIVRSQVLFMEPLSVDSKIRKAILDYENK